MQAGVYPVYMLIIRKYYDMSCTVFEKLDTFGKTFALRMQRFFLQESDKFSGKILPEI